MDFFAAQDKAHQQTGRLIGLLVFGLVVMTSAVYAATMLVIHLAGGWLLSNTQQGYDEGSLAQQGAAARWIQNEVVWWDPRVAVAVLVGMLILVGGGYLYRWAQLRSGGERVAEMLGGRRIDMDTLDPAQRRALNVVEEMAIASGMPVPPVYVMPSDAINAFAAGHTVDQAVVGLTEGCIDRLTREQLQGVVAHEFSHIFNGDMRLNVRLVAVINGVMVLGVAGYILWRYIGYAMLFSGGGRRGGKNDGMPIAIAVMILGALLCVIGFAGTLVARLIQAAVSRQREFLADASAVQYTRETDGIAGALRAIGGAPRRTKLATETSQFNHMFFNQAMPSLFASHPPLPQRIARIEGITPEQVGELRPKLTEAQASERWAQGMTQRKAAEAGQATGQPAVAGMMGAVAMAGLTDALSKVGDVHAVDMAWTREVLSHVPRKLYKAVHAPQYVPAVVLGLLVHEQGDNAAAVQKQLRTIAQTMGDVTAQQVQQLLPSFGDLDDRCRVPLLDLASPVLSRLSHTQRQAFRTAVEQVVMADGQVTRFEWVATLLVDVALDRGGAAAHAAQARLTQVQSGVEMLLTVVARAGTDDAQEALVVVQAGCTWLKVKSPTQLVPVSLKQLNAAVHDLRTLKFAERGRLMQAVVGAVEHDGRTTVAEAEMVRAVAELLAIPMPPVVPEATHAA